MPALEIFLLEVKDTLETTTMTAFLFLTAQSRRLGLEVLLSTVLAGTGLIVIKGYLLTPVQCDRLGEISA
jgi:hypothetical protein